MYSKVLGKLDWVLLIIVPVIIVFGVTAIYSASGGFDAQSRKFALACVQKQIAVGIAGFVLLFLAASLDDNVWPRITKWIYWGSVSLLVFVDFAGRHTKGAQRWIDIGPIQLQPSEPAKIALIITLSVYLLAHYDEIRELRTFLLSLLHISVPLLLVFKQPDLGTSLVMGAIWLGVVLAAGVQWKHVFGLMAVGAVMAVVVWNVGILKEYQKQRVITLINPEADPQRTGYHVRQAKIAIGAGEITGTGYGKGSQTQLDFIPEQWTDFIFTEVGEEMGFAGSAALLLLYWMLIARVIYIMQSTEERLGRMISGGVLAVLLFHVFVNVGMTMGIMPVAGVPLPFFSYGPSNLLSMLTAMGLVMGVYTRRHRIAFGHQ